MRDDHAIHGAAAAGEVDAVRRWLDADAALLEIRDRKGATPLHRAVAAGAPSTVALLLDRGADIHARHLDGPGDADGYAPVDFEPVDVALFEHDRGDVPTARLLVERGAAYDLTVAATCGDLAHVAAALDAAPDRISEARPHGRRPLSAAVVFGHDAIVRLLLDRGADPTWAATRSSACCSIAAPIPRGRRAPTARAAPRSTLPRDAATWRWSISCSITVPTPTPTSTPPARRPMPQGRRRSAPACWRAAACSTATTWCGWTRTTRWSAASPRIRPPPTPAAGCTLPPRRWGSAIWWLA